MTDNTPVYLYKYISFEMLVNMIQKSALTFSLIGAWDDFHEFDPFIYSINNENNKLLNQLTLCQIYKTYCQCWTELSESDAMWRIYSYGNKSIRVKVKTSNLLSVNNLEIRKVIYTDSILSEIDKCITNKDYLQLYAIKREAFAHEKEYRIIDLYKFNGIDDAKNHCEALNNYLTEFKDIDCKVDEIKSKIEKDLILLNVGKFKVSHKYINVKSVNELIEGIMMNPFSPKWFAETVEKYCEINNIKYDGISKLYEK